MKTRKGNRRRRREVGRIGGSENGRGVIRIGGGEVGEEDRRW